MQVDTVRKNAQPFGTEYSCMMAIVLDGKLVVVRPNTKEFEAVERIVRASAEHVAHGQVKHASDADIAFFVKQLMAVGPQKA